MRRIPLVLVSIALLLGGTLAAQQPPPLPPEVGNAVLLATHSINVARDTVVHTGDLVVNNAEPPPYLGELELSIDQGVRTPAGFALKANGVDIDRNAVVAGDVHYNVLQNDGTILGAQVTPLALPVIGTLPMLPDRPAGEEDIVVADDTQRILGRGNYGALVLGRNARLRLPGGPYTFTSITAERGASIFWDGPGDVIVKGRMRLGADVTIGSGPGVNTKRKMFFVHGADGVDELLQPLYAVVTGSNSNITSTIHAPNGSVIASEGLTLLGSIVARDIRIGRDSALTLRSGFRNLPPVAISQNVSTNGAQSVTITLSGFDPDSDPLTFTIGLQPSFGNLSAITQTGPTTAVVVYTTESEDPDDAFSFRVTDTEGFFANGFVTINEGQVPGPPTTIIAEDSVVDVPPGRPTILQLIAVGPPGVPITLSIVPNSGPEHGTLGPLQQPSQNPPRNGSVVYAPAPGYLGEDQFRFQACGVINGEEVCDDARVLITVEGPEPPPELAPDLTASTSGTTAVAITLGNPNAPPPTEPGSTVIAPAAVAGSVSDANGDEIGDASAAPPLVSAGIGQPSGTVRIHMEFDVSNLGEVAADLESATVLLRTNRGAEDTAATTFHAVGSSGDGQLSASDFQMPAESIPGAVMNVPLSQPVGADGGYSFNVLAELRDALLAGFTHFAIQGRVPEVSEAEGPESGLHVYTNDPANPPQVRPQLGLAIQGEEIARTYSVLSLPSQGSLTDSNGNVITAVPYTLPSPVVTYRAPSGFTGQVTFSYSVSQEQATDTGTVTVTVSGGDGDGR